MKGVKEEVSFVDIYQMMGIDERIEFIIEHYSGLKRMMDAFEVGLITNIQRERRYKRSVENGDLGVRIQTSGHADPTGNGASSNGDIRTYIRQGDYMSALKGTENFFKYKAQIITLMEMREDYNVVDAAVDSIIDECEIYVKYLNKECSIASAVETEGLSEQAVKSRFYRAKKLLINRTKLFMETNSEYSLLKIGA